MLEEEGQFEQEQTHLKINYAQEQCESEYSCSGLAVTNAMKKIFILRYVLPIHEHLLNGILLRLVVA
jgi:hypothetical protein